MTDSERYPGVRLNHGIGSRVMDRVGAVVLWLIELQLRGLRRWG